MSQVGKKNLPKEIMSNELNGMYTITTKGMQKSGWVPSYNQIRHAITQTCNFDAYALYILLLSHYNDKTGQTFATTSLLSKETKWGVKKVSRLITELYNAGFIIVNSGANHKASNFWFPFEPYFDPKDKEMLQARKRSGKINDKNKVSESYGLIKKEKEHQKIADSLNKEYKKDRTYEQWMDYLSSCVASGVTVNLKYDEEAPRSWTGDDDDDIF